MEHHDSQQKLRLPRSQSAIPYYRRDQNSTTVYGAKSFQKPKGRIHDPNATISTWCTHGDRGRETLMNPDHFSHGATHDKMIQAHFKKEANQAHELLITDQSYESLKNCFIPNIEISQSRVAVKMLGNLALSDVAEDDERRKDKFVNSREEDGRREVISDAKMKSSSQDSFYIRRSEGMPKVLSGTVRKVTDWLKLRNNCELFIEVISSVIDIKPGEWPSQKFLILRDEKNTPSLQVVFYEIDRAFPRLCTGDMVKCIGRPLSRNCIQAFKIEQSSEEERNESQRLFFISNMSAKEAMASIAKN